MPTEGAEILVENPELREAAAVVLERVDDPEDEVTWADVSDALSSGQWGRLIQEDVLVSGSSGFVVANPAEIRSRLNEPAQLPHSPPGGTSWQWYDKAAGVFALALAMGYWNTGIRNLVASFDDFVLTPITGVFPFHVVVLMLALATGIYSTILQSKLTDFETMQAYRDRMNAITEREKAAKERGDEEALERIREEKAEAARDQLGMFKLQFRPMVWIMLLTIPVFLWIRWKVRSGHLSGSADGIVVPLAGHVSFQQGLLGPIPTWIVWYMVCSIASRQVVQKLSGLQTSPDS